MNKFRTHSFQVESEHNLSRNLLDKYNYRTVWVNNTIGYARRERTLRKKSDSFARTNNFESKPNI